MFQKKRINPPTTPVNYPHGTFVKSEAGWFYIASDKKRYRLSYRAMLSWRPHRVVETTEAALKNYKIAAKMQFRNGSLIWNLSDGKIYLIEHGKRRHVQSPDALINLGIAEIPSGAVDVVSLDEINLHEEGEPLT